MDFQPGSWRYTYRKGDEGNDVGVLQLNLGNVAVDGVFGPATKTRVQRWQEQNALVVDGVAGPSTQESIVDVKSAPASTTHEIPKGILKSISFNESGFFVAASGPHLSDGGYDVGAYMRSTGAWPGDSDFYRSAFDVAESAEWTAAKLRSVRESVPTPVSSRYLTDIGHDDKRAFKWQLAVLAHNWPGASYNIPRLGRVFQEEGRDDSTEQWIVSASGGRLHTPREWVTSYIAKATVFASL